jgi:hypothetical protein
MDHVFERAQVLERELQNFNQRLGNAFDQLEQSHARVSPLWDDSMRREYDKSWKPLNDAMHDYIKRTGPRYVEVLIERLRHLKSYLHGS